MRPREVVRWFGREMERVLRRHDHKGGWDTSDSETLDYLKERMSDETRELHVALRKLWKAEDSWDATAEQLDALRQAAANEAVDVANIAMMIADCLIPGNRDQAPAPVRKS